LSESVRIANVAAPAVDHELEAEPLPLPVHEGDVLADKYRIDRLIGIGGMAAVLRATHLELDQVVAIKLLRPEQISKADAVKRFLREARAAVKLRSTHVARVLDVGTAEVSPTIHVPYMVMEHLEGSDFETILEGHGRFPQEEAVEYLLQACDAVGEAHALGIVHRDLKPANLFLTTKRDGTALVKLLDFGISKNTRTTIPLDNQKITHEHAMMGSPAYMSPEQVRSTKDVDHRADIWSLGAILYELLTGKEPWMGETSADTFAMILTEPPPRVRDLNPDVHPDLEGVVMRCLEKNREARWQSVGELANALLRFAPRRNLSVAPTWDSANPPPPSISGIPSSNRIPLVDSQRLAQLDSQRLAALDSQRILTPSPMQAWQPPPSSGHISFAPSSGHIALTPAAPRSIPSGRMVARTQEKMAPWWQLPAILGAVFGLLALVAIILVVAVRARIEASRAAKTASSAAASVEPAPASADEPSSKAAVDPLPAASPTSAASTGAASTVARPSTVAPIAPAAPAKPKAATSGIPRHRTDW
jgi:eukaryotic-like serine/threonine-protein kinase